MIIFIEDSNINNQDLKRLQEYLDETNSGIVITVKDIYAIRTERT